MSNINEQIEKNKRASQAATEQKETVNVKAEHGKAKATDKAVN